MFPGRCRRRAGYPCRRGRIQRYRGCRSKCRTSVLSFPGRFAAIAATVFYRMGCPSHYIVYPKKPLVTAKIRLIFRFSNILPEYTPNDIRVPIRIFLRPGQIRFRLIWLVSSFLAFWRQDFLGQGRVSKLMAMGF